MNDIDENRVGKLNGHTGGSFAYQVYKTDGIAPTLTRMGDGGGRTPFIIEDVYSCAMRGRKHEEDGDYIQELEVNSNIVSNSITSVSKDSMVMEKVKVEKLGSVYNDGSQCGTVVSENGLSATISAGTHGYCNAHVQQGYRIRKITPRESFRLMNFSDEDYEKAANVNSKTQLLKEAGNAIVVNCLVAIFGQMFEGHEDDYKKFAKDIQY